MISALGEVKIGDFGVSKRMKLGEKCYDQAGTPSYLAPELIRPDGYSGFKADMWSAGCLLYAMVVGSLPFPSSTIAELHEQILAGNFTFQRQIRKAGKTKDKGADNFSAEVKDLIIKLLQVDPQKRLSAEETLMHPWLQNAPSIISELFTENEKCLNLQDYHRLKQEMQSSNEPVETDALLTQYPLETDDLSPERQNIQDKSFVLAPFNSMVNLDDTLDDLMLDFEPKAIKFDRKVREINRQYEENNNEDLDNGVQNQCFQ